MAWSVATCRMCGVDCAEHELSPAHPGGGCVECKGSPACARCGHARRHHRGTFSSHADGCIVRVTLAGSLATGRCGCSGYTQDPGSFGEETPAVDVVEPRLRTAGDPPDGAGPLLAPVRDVFDEGRRLRELGEPEGLPWRPPH
jgi:hypothetical protein